MTYTVHDNTIQHLISNELLHFSINIRYALGKEESSSNFGPIFFRLQKYMGNLNSGFDFPSNDLPHALQAGNFAFAILVVTGDE